MLGGECEVLPSRGLRGEDTSDAWLLSGVAMAGGGCEGGAMPFTLSAQLLPGLKIYCE